MDPRYARFLRRSVHPGHATRDVGTIYRGAAPGRIGGNVSDAAQEERAPRREPKALFPRLERRIWEFAAALRARLRPAPRPLPGKGAKQHISLDSVYRRNYGKGAASTIDLTAARYLVPLGPCRSDGESLHTGRYDALTYG
jgi:hypothetical protein